MALRTWLINLSSWVSRTATDLSNPGSGFKTSLTYQCCPSEGNGAWDSIWRGGMATERRVRSSGFVTSFRYQCCWPGVDVEVMVAQGAFGNFSVQQMLKARQATFNPGFGEGTIREGGGARQWGAHGGEGGLPQSGRTRFRIRRHDTRERPPQQKLYRGTVLRENQSWRGIA